MFLCKANKEALVKVLMGVFRRKRTREAFKRNEALVGEINLELIVKELLRWSMDPQAYGQSIVKMWFLKTYEVELVYERDDTTVFVMFNVLDKRRLAVHTRIYNVWHTYTFAMQRGWWKVLEGKSLGQLFERR